MAIHLERVLRTWQIAILSSSPAPKSRLSNVSMNDAKNTSIAARTMRLLCAGDFRAVDAKFQENAESIMDTMAVSMVLNVRVAMKYAEKSSPLPFSSATYFESADDRLKSEISWARPVISVRTASVPMSSCVIARASRASPTAPIIVVSRFRIVR